MFFFALYSANLEIYLTVFEKPGIIGEIVFDITCYDDLVTKCLKNVRSRSRNNRQEMRNVHYFLKYLLVYIHGF